MVPSFHCCHSVGNSLTMKLIVCVDKVAPVQRLRRKQQLRIGSKKLDEAFVQNHVHF